MTETCCLDCATPDNVCGIPNCRSNVYVEWCQKCYNPNWKNLTDNPCPKFTPKNVKRE